MKMDDFAKRMCTAVEEKLGGGIRTEVRQVRKNNGILLHGLLIPSEGRSVVPTIYLESFMEECESGIPFEEVVCKLLAVYQRDVPPEDIDMGFFLSYEAVKDRICYRLIGRKGNEDLLAEVPHVDFLDMAICFYYAYHRERVGDGSVPIYNSHMKMWDTCTEELFQLAQENTPRIFPWEYSGMDEILNEAAKLDGESIDFLLGDEAAEALPKNPMKILSNQKKLHGAVCILYPGVMEEIARKEGNVYIIPCSIHETILLPDDGKKSVGELKEMIHEVNCTQVMPEEVLSDSLYYYDAAKNEIVMA